MKRHFISRHSLVVVAGALALAVFGWYQTTAAQQKGGQLPFANSNEQRSDMVKELREIKELLREQNEILKAMAAQNASASKR